MSSKTDPFNIMARILLFVVAISMLTYAALQSQGFEVFNFDIGIMALGEDITIPFFILVGIVFSIISGSLLNKSMRGG